MLQGWSLPQSSSGAASLVPPPPWHFAGDIISVEFAADPKRVAALLPHWLEPSDDGSCTFVFCDWCSAADNDPRLAADPARGQYKEAYLVVDARHEGHRVARIPFIWVDSDLSLLRGLIQGFPKKLGQIAMSRATGLGRAGARREPGGVFAAHVSMLGRRLATASVAITTVHDDTARPSGVTKPLLHTRMLPSLAGERPTVYERARAQIVDFSLGQTFSGDAALEFGASEYEELDLLGPTEVRRGWVSSVAYSVVGGSEDPLPWPPA